VLPLGREGALGADVGRGAAVGAGRGAAVATVRAVVTGVLATVVGGLTVVTVPAGRTVVGVAAPALVVAVAREGLAMVVAVVAARFTTAGTGCLPVRILEALAFLTVWMTGLPFAPRLIVTTLLLLLGSGLGLA
jgi:hypothetical protein